MKIREIYGDILGRIAIDIPNDRITSGDVVSIIWESAGQVRQGYFNGGLYEPFAVTKSVDYFINKSDPLYGEYPGFKYADIEAPIYKSIPVQNAILSSFVSKTSNRLREYSTDVYQRGDLVRKDDRLLFVLENAVPGTYDGPIVTGKDVRHFVLGNGAKFFKNQWFYEKESDAYYIVHFEFINTVLTIEELQQQGIIEQALVMDIGPAFVEANLTSIGNLAAIRTLQSNGDGAVGFAIEGDKVIMGKDAGDILLLTYIPELVRPKNMDDEIVMPEFAVSQIVMLALQKIAYAIGVTLPEVLTEETDEDEQPASE